MKRRRETHVVPADQQAANDHLLHYRELRAKTRGAQDRAAKMIARIREDLVAATANWREEMKSLHQGLAEYYREHRPHGPRGEKHLKLQDGTIGERFVPRVVVSNSMLPEIERVAPKAVSVRKEINKRALKAAGEQAMAAAGARVVRPLKFYVRPYREDAAR